MSALGSLWSEPWVERLGWVLIHFIWQGAGIALLLGVALRLLTRASSQARYLVIGGALLVCGVTPVATWAVLGSETESPPAVAPVETEAENAPTILPPDSSSVATATWSSAGNGGMDWQDRLRQEASTALPYVVGLWFGGVLILTFRLTLGWTLMQRLCRSGLPIQDSRCLEKFQRLVERMEVSMPVRLLESALVEVPTLIGWLRPTILVPASVLMGLSPDQLEAILAHELAHVRRYDYLVNLFQTVIETILFYHPAVWWISRKLREERENCCDDIALEVMRDKLVYVSALARLEEGRGLPLALTASGGSLVQRIRRIAGANDRKVSAWPLWLMIFGVLTVVCLTRGKASDQATSQAQSAIEISDTRFEELHDNLCIQNLKVQDMPLDQFIEKISRELAALDPQKKGLNFVLNIPPGEPPIRISLDFTKIPGFRANIFGIMDQLKFHYPIRYKQDDTLYYIQQISNDEIAFDRKADSTHIDLDFNNTDVVAALKSVQAASASKGFSFDLDLKVVIGLDAIKRFPAIDLKATQVSVAQALRSIFYLEDLTPTPLEKFKGYRVAPGSIEALHKQTLLKIQIEIVSFQADDAPGISHFLADPRAGPNGSQTFWREPTLFLGAYPWSHGKEMGQSGWVSMDFMPLDRTKAKTTFKFGVEPTVMDKTHVQIAGTVEIKAPDGTILGNMTGQWTAPSGTFVNLLSNGQPMVLKSPDGSISNQVVFVLAQASFVDEDEKLLVPSSSQVEEVELSKVTKNSDKESMPETIDAASAPSAATETTAVGAIQPAAETTEKAQAGLVMVRISTKIMQVGEDDYQDHRSEIDAAVQRGDDAPLSQLKSSHLLFNLLVFTKSGEQAVMESCRVFPYADAFAKDASGNLQPTDFTKQNLGVRFVVLPTLTDNPIDFKGDLKITSLEGWSPTGENTYKPLFHVRDAPVSESFASGQTQGFEMPGGAQMEPFDPTVGFTPDKIPDASQNPKTLSRIFFFVTAKAYSASGKPLTGNDLEKADAGAYATDAVSPSPASGHATTSVKEPDPDEWTIHDLKVSDMPLTELAQKLTAMTQAEDPKGIGARIDVKVPSGGSPLKITYGYPPYTGDLGNLLYRLAELYPIRYELQIASHNPDAKQAPITLTQLPAVEAQLNKKAGETKIDLNFNGTDFITALNVVQSEAATKGFRFEINVDALKGLSLPPITLKAHSWSVQHAILSLCYLADLVSQPLESFTGYGFRSGSVTELHDRTRIRFGIVTGSCKVDDTTANSRILRGLGVLGSGIKLWGPAEVMPAYSWVYRGKEMAPMGGTIGMQFSYHHKAGDPPDFLAPVEGAPHLEAGFKTFVADKTHIRTTITLRLKKSDGTVLRELTGETTAPSGAILNLVIHGAPLQLDTPDDPTTKSNLYVFAQADYVDNGERETDIEPQPLELASPENIIQQVEMSDAGANATDAVSPSPAAAETTAVAGTQTDLYYLNELTVRSFLVPAGFFPANSGTTVGLKQELIKRGIEFPADASATYLPGTGKMVVRDTPDELDKLATQIEAFLRAESAQGPENADVGAALNVLPELAANVLTELAAPSPDVALRIMVHLARPEMVDLDKSVGHLVTVDGHDYEMYFQPDGSLALPHVKPGPYNFHISFVRKQPSPSPMPPEAFEMQLAPIVVDSTSRQMTVNLNLAPPFKDTPKGSVQVGMIVAEVPEDAYEANKSAFDTGLEKESASVITLINNLKGGNLVSTPSVTTRPGLKANIEIVREFPFPTQFEDPQMVKHVQPDGSIILGKVPATPTDFVKKDIGISAEVTPSIDNGNSPDHGKIILTGKLTVTDFEGFTKSNLVGTGTPSFTTREAHFLEALDDNEVKGIWIPGVYTDALMTDAGKSGKKRLILFLSAKLVE